MSAVIETTLGDVTVDLYLKERPRACLNFLKLCKIKYYNYNLFHTISRGFIAQTGDPTGSRTGGESIFGVLEGPSKRFFEAENKPRIKHTNLGKISFVGNEECMIGSQFFITLGEDLTYLDDKHCVFGEVVDGFDILEVVNEVICDTDDRPYQDVRITHTVVLDDPFPDPKGLRAPSRSPSPNAKRLQGGRIAPDEDVDETAGKNAKEIAEFQAEREAKARATILEMVGDIPDAEMAPPENVLFVCKLNPVTTDDDLEIIFSRFGKIKSCEVIRDRKTGDSLQYAFIEFEERKSCEDAYFKMDNVLIDDRRIHVDFSQSVSKVKWHGKGRGVTHYDDKGKKRTDNNNDIGKGNYKIKNGDRKRSRSRSPVRKQNSRRDHSRSRDRNDRYKQEDYYRSHRKDQFDRRRDPRERERSPRRNRDITYRREDRRYNEDRNYRNKPRASPHERRKHDNKKKEVDKYKKSKKSSSEETSSENDGKKIKENKTRDKTKSKKKRRKSTSDEESSSDDEESDKKEKKKKKPKKSKKYEESSSEEERKSKKKKKARRDSSSDSDRKRRKSKKKRKDSSSSSSDSSDD